VCVADVSVVPDAVVSVVPVVVSVAAVVEVEVPAVLGVELEPVVAAVSVTDVEVVSLLVVVSVPSFLHATAKTTRATTQRTARLFFIMFLSLPPVSEQPRCQ
jgi:hypothetical protein